MPRRTPRRVIAHDSASPLPHLRAVLPAYPALMIEEPDWIRLGLTPGIGPVLWGRMMRGELGQGAQAEVLATARRAVPDALLESHRLARERLGASLLTPASADWPEALRVLEDPPAMLFHRGDSTLLSRPQIAFVGARRASRRALDDAAWLVHELAGAGLIVTSGLALGVDGAAHRAALDCGGTTIAVLGSGLDRIYPARHRGLAERIAAEGLLLSEFLPGTPALPHHFPRRNRLVSGLSLGVVVVEAGVRSGSMITARLAAQQGREVFALPSHARDLRAGGNLRLLREGAVLVRDAGDILTELGLERTAVKREVRAASPAEAAVLDAMVPEGTDFSTLILRTGLDASELAVRITELELDGLLERDGDRLYPRTSGTEAGPRP